MKTRVPTYGVIYDVLNRLPSFRDEKTYTETELDKIISECIDKEEAREFLKAGSEMYLLKEDGTKEHLTAKDIYKEMIDGEG